MKKIIPFICFGLFACGNPARFQQPVPVEVTGDVTAVPVSVFLAAFDQGSELHLKAGETADLTVGVVLKDGSIVSGLNTLFEDAASKQSDDINWVSQNRLVVSVDGQGKITAVKPGRAGIAASVFNVTAKIWITVDPAEGEPAVAPEEPLPPPPEALEPGLPVSRFLSLTDHVTVMYGENAGFGQENYPDAVLGAPGDGVGVLTLGGGGSILIELDGAEVVDGAGPDFAVFENPQGPNLFAERAQVSVSADGIHFFNFPCDAWDEDGNGIYEGCAGVYPVGQISEPLDLAVAGGDDFDLALSGLMSIRFIQIVDLNTCIQGDSTFPLCRTPTKQGFDLDAVAIVNGMSL